MKNKKIIPALEASINVTRLVLDGEEEPTTKMIMHNQLFIMEGIKTFLEEPEPSTDTLFEQKISEITFKIVDAVNNWLTLDYRETIDDKSAEVRNDVIRDILKDSTKEDK